MICLVCGNKINGYDDSEWYGLDGDRIHIKCKPNVDKAIESLISMSDSEFEKYMKGERELL